MKKINPRTPLGRLVLEKHEIRQQCRESEMKIQERWQYIHTHAGRLLLAELKTVFMPRRKNSDEQVGGGGLMNNPWMHMAWQIAKPIAYRWMGEVGWQVFKSMFRKRR